MFVSYYVSAALFDELTYSETEVESKHVQRRTGAANGDSNAAGAKRKALCH